MEQFALEKTYPASAAAVREVFWDIQRWQKIWDPVNQVAVRYDDRLMQEFEMGLMWKGSPVTIRTVRFLEQNGDIEFFSPNPPGDFSRHTGSWRFSDLGDGTCRIVAERRVEVRRLETESDEEYQLRKGLVLSAFQARVTRLLGSFDSYFC